MRKGLYILFIMFLAAACQKDQDTVEATDQTNLLKFVKAVTNGEEVIQTAFLYDERGRIVSSTHYNHYESNVIGHQTVYFYESNRLIRTESKMNMSSELMGTNFAFTSVHFQYNNNGQITQTNNYLKTASGNYELRSFTVYTYEAGKPAKATQYNEDGSLNLYRLYHYENGNMTKEELFYNNSDTAEIRRYQYDSFLNPYVHTFHPVENVPYSISNNNITEMVFGFDAKSQTVYEYNAAGLPTKMQQGGNTFIFVY